jgi:hypothetical protein
MREYDLKLVVILVLVFLLIAVVGTMKVQKQEQDMLHLLVQKVMEDQLKQVHFEAKLVEEAWLSMNYSHFMKCYRHH